MDTFIKFRSIGSRLMFWFIIAALLSLSYVFAIVYHQRVYTLKGREINKLVAIRDLRVEQINGRLDRMTSGVCNLA